MRYSVFAGLLSAIFFIAGCASPPRAVGPIPLEVTTSASWRGRLALRVDSDTPQLPDQPRGQSFFAGFELTGSAQAGELALFTPLGTTLATLVWSPTSGQLRTGAESRQFESLGAMVRQATGTEIPVAELFSWLTGKNVAVPGWQVDLSHYSEGRVVARRDNPLPTAELKLVFEKQAMNPP